MSDNWIQTANNLAFDFEDLGNVEFPIGEIAHALSNMCRYNGHCNRFYSVAEHSVLVSEMVPQEYQLEALLHDAHEAYVGDVPSPLKRILPDYQQLEQEVAENFRLVYDLPTVCSDVVKHADFTILCWEKFHLFGKEPKPWVEIPQMNPVEERGIRMYGNGPSCSQPSQAYNLFMLRYNELTNNGSIYE